MATALKKSIPHNAEAVRVRMGDFFTRDNSSPAPARMPRKATESAEAVMAARIEQAYRSGTPLTNFSKCLDWATGQDQVELDDRVAGSNPLTEAEIDGIDEALLRSRMVEQVAFDLKSERVSLDEKTRWWLWMIVSLDFPESDHPLSFRPCVQSREMIPEAEFITLLWHCRKQFIALFGRQTYDFYWEMYGEFHTQPVSHHLCSEATLHLGGLH